MSAFNRTSLELKQSLSTQENMGDNLPFNRTSLELKQCGWQSARLNRGAFNRTSLELKLILITPPVAFRLLAFNRTSLELKRDTTRANAYTFRRLLIAPVWN